MSDTLDVNQQWVLQQLQATGEWYLGSPWKLENRKVTMTILDELVRQGLAEIQRLPRRGTTRIGQQAMAVEDVYVPSTAAEAAQRQRTARFHELVHSAPAWHPLVTLIDAHGPREFLAYGPSDVRPVHNGALLELQGRESVATDSTEGFRRLATGILVRFEAAIISQRAQMTPLRTLRVTAEIGGYPFTRLVESWMGFRWPQ